MNATTIAMKTIVVPTDCGRLSLNALRYADRLAARSGAKVVAVYGAVFESPDGVGVAAALASEDDREMMMAPVRRCIEASLAQTLSPDTKHEIVLEDCEAADAIVEVAKRYDADVIIIGTHDRNRLLRAVLGSVTDEVLRLTTRPVLVLREQNNDPIRRVVCVEKEAEAAARRLAEAAGAEFVSEGGENAGDVLVVGKSSPLVRTAHVPVLVAHH
ncbi:MAG TPA: universal stress protein [Thermoanaerobaculia bacterium]|nr:universal stress protein [Thermoanaerobaculia bacterium]